MRTDYQNEIEKMTPRGYVGGAFEQIGAWQFWYMRDVMGVEPGHVFLDVACGCFRLGKHMIQYLDKGGYHGMDAVEQIVEYGMENELPKDWREKEPTIYTNSDFDFSKSQGFDFAWANSLFSHMTKEDFEKGLRGVRDAAKPSSQFWFTFFLGSSQNNPAESHSNRHFMFSEYEVRNICSNAGWDFEFAPVQNHPRGQKIVKATPK